MGKIVLIWFVVSLGLVNVLAITYPVGDSSGWDISTDLDSWSQSKKFAVGDALMFLYSSSHSVDEVTKDDYDNCNTGNVIRTFSTGNTTVPLTRPGMRYFICGNQLHCLGGMKVLVNVEGNQATSPVGAPQAQPTGSNQLPKPSSKSNNNNNVPVNSGGFVFGVSRSLVFGFVGLVSTIFMLA